MNKLNIILLIAGLAAFLATGTAVFLKRQTTDIPAQPDTAVPNQTAPAGTPITTIQLFGYQGDKIIIEAETGTDRKAPLQIQKDSTASGGACISIKEGAGKPPETGGSITCSFTINKAADYTLWGRRWWMDACGNSLSLSIQGEQAVAIISQNNISAEKPHLFGDDASYNPDIGLPWKWTSGQVYRFVPGEYTITIANREDGVKLDQILLVEKLESDPYTPVGIETSSAP